MLICMQTAGWGYGDGMRSGVECRGDDELFVLYIRVEASTGTTLAQHIFYFIKWAQQLRTYIDWETANSYST